MARTGSRQRLCAAVPVTVCLSAFLLAAGVADVAAQKPVKPCNGKKCPDTAPPSVSIQSPSAGATVSGLVTIAGTASDNVGVSRVEVQLDSQQPLAASGTTSWSLTIDSRLQADGGHTVSARAFDAAGNSSALATIPLNFANTPGSGPNVLTVVDVRVDRPTLHALGVQVLIAGDENRNGRVTVQYREAGSVTWREGLPLLRVFPETITVAVPQQFAGSVFDLAPDTAYEIALRAKDTDGGVNVTRLVTARTRPVPRTDPASPRIVAVSTASALRTALSSARAGDVITLSAGTYAGPFAISASGTETQPIVIRGTTAAGVVLDGGNCSSCNVLEVSGSYVHIEELTITNARRGLRFTGANTIRNVARRLEIRDVVHGAGSTTGQTDFYVCDNVIDGRLQWPWVFGANPSSHWDDRGVEVTGDGHVVCHNTIRGFGDPVINMKRQARSWDVYGNDIADAWDGVELDEGEGNVRLFHNRFTNVMAPVSIQPSFGGPLYALRNVGFNLPDEPIKLKSLGGVEEPSGALIYHNTFVSPNRALNLLSSITQHNFVIGNNLFVGPDVLAGTRTVDWRAGINHGVFDYNGYYPDGAFMFGTVNGVNRLYSSFAQAQASGAVESHGVLLGRLTFQSGIVGPGDARVTYAPPDFSLAATAIAIDRGQRLPGVNDGFAGAAPDLGALERGCPVPVYGPRVEGLEAFTLLINCES